MEIKSLTEELTKILEGDVVSFADYASKKQEPKQEEPQEVSKSGNPIVHIDSVIIKWAEGPQDDNRFPFGKELSYEEAQAMIFEQDYAFQVKPDSLGYDKVGVTVNYTIDGEKQSQDGRVDLGDGKYGIEAIDMRTWFDDCEVSNKPVEYKLEEYKKKYGTREENIDKFLAENPVELPAPKTDYSAKKDPVEVAVGDIFYDSEYSNYREGNIYSFFRVVRRTKASVWLEKLGQDVTSVPAKKEANDGRVILDTDHYIMPNDKVNNDKVYGLDLDKPFKLQLDWNKLVCAKQKDNWLRLWNGKALKESKESGYSLLNNALLEAVGYDFYGPMQLPDEDEGTFRIYYNGGNGVSEYLKKARNGRYVWKNAHNFDYANGEQPFTTTDYKLALELVDKFGGTVEKVEEE